MTKLVSESKSLFIQGIDLTWDSLRTRFKYNAEQLMPGFKIKPKQWHTDIDDGFVNVEFVFDTETTIEGLNVMVTGTGIADVTHIRLREISIALSGRPVVTIPAFSDSLSPSEVVNFINRLIKNIYHGNSNDETRRQVG